MNPLDALVARIEAGYRRELAGREGATATDAPPLTASSSTEPNVSTNRDGDRPLTSAIGTNGVAISATSMLAETAASDEHDILMGNNTTGHSPNIREAHDGPGPRSDSPEVDRARALVKQAGVRIMSLDGVTTIGIWSDWDGPELRAALRTMRLHQAPVLFLDRDPVPVHYKLRRCDYGPGFVQPIPWPEWCARELNGIFAEHGALKQPGRFTAEHIRQATLRRTRGDGSS